MRKLIKNLGGINLYVNPLAQEDGQLIRAVNVDSRPYQAKTKRPGYVTHLGTPDNNRVNSLWSWTKNDGSTLFLYRASGSLIYYSIQGTGDWTVAGNGTISNGGHVGHAVLDNTMIVGDGVGSTRHTTSGTAFTNTTLAPVSPDFEQYQNRIYAIGTSSNEFYSTTGDATNWNTSGTSDSNSFVIPGAGKNNKIFKVADRVTTSKNSQIMHRWDGFSLIDMSTDLGLSSPYSYGQKEDYGFWLNDVGIIGYGGARPQLLSNAIESQIYNDNQTGISGAAYGTAPGVVHKYDYMLAVGTITDDFTNEQIPDAIIKYNYQKNEYLNYSFSHPPTAWHSYKDATGVRKLIFGDVNGQCYHFGGTAKTDNGNTIYSVMEYVLHLNTLLPKKFNYFRAVFNPGCQAKLAIAIEDTFVKGAKKWSDLGDSQTGVVEYRFEQGKNRGAFLFIRVYEASRDARFTHYSFEVDADIIER